MIQEGFLTNLDTLELFFRICRKYKIEGAEPRTALIRELTRRKKATYLRDVNEFVKDKHTVVIRKKEK